jgi:hypothetical protein
LIDCTLRAEITFRIFIVVISFIIMIADDAATAPYRQHVTAAFHYYAATCHTYYADELIVPSPTLLLKFGRRRSAHSETAALEHAS